MSIRSINCGTFRLRSWIVLTVVLAGCTHAPLGLRMESSGVSTQLGFPHCDVSAPLSQAEVLASARRIGIENMESSLEWSETVAMTRHGDQLRLAVCPASRHRVPGQEGGYAIYGLFRNNTLVREFGQVIND